MEQELAPKKKWILRLEAIARHAGASAGFHDVREDELFLTVDEAAKLKHLALAKGAYRTLAVHVRHVERLMQFGKDRRLPVFPLSTDMVLKYCLFPFNSGCGPSVIPSIRAALTWVGSRLLIAMPDLSDPRLLALEAKVVEERGKELKESQAVPLVLVAMLEVFVMTVADTWPVRWIRAVHDVCIPSVR